MNQENIRVGSIVIYDNGLNELTYTIEEVTNKYFKAKMWLSNQSLVYEWNDIDNSEWRVSEY